MNVDYASLAGDVETGLFRESLKEELDFGDVLVEGKVKGTDLVARS